MEVIVMLAFLVGVLLVKAFLVKLFISFKIKASYAEAVTLNIFSLVSFIISGFIVLAFFNNLPGTFTREKHYLAGVFIILLSALMDSVIFCFHWEKASWMSRFLTAFTVNFFIWGTLIHFWLLSTRFNYERNRISCTSNLKQIGLSLYQYSNDNNGYMPDKSNAAGMEMLRANDYLTDYGVYVCTEKLKDKGKDGQKITESNFSYIYRGGLKVSNDSNNYKIPVIWDKPTNHENYGNVLFLDGHVKGFAGKDWMEQAGIKKTANKGSK